MQWTFPHCRQQFPPCRQWTIGKFLTHEAIQSGVFNQNYCGATPSMSGWEEALTNSTPLLNLVLDRMESDFAALNPKMRKPYGPVQVEAWEQIRSGQWQVRDQIPIFLLYSYCVRTQAPCNYSRGNLRRFLGDFAPGMWCIHGLLQRVCQEISSRFRQICREINPEGVSRPNQSRGVKFVVECLQ